MESRLKKRKINETKSWFFKNIDKIDKPSGRVNKKKAENTEIRNKRGI